MRLDRALNYRKPQTTSPRPRCDEGIEQSVTNQRCDSGSLVDYDDSVCTCSELRLARQLMFLKQSTLDDHLAIGGRGLHRIQQQVENRPVQQVFIALDDHRRLRKPVDDADSIRNSRLSRHQAGGVPRDLGDVDLGNSCLPRSRKVEEFREHAGNSIRLALDQGAEHLLIFRCPRHSRQLLDGAADGCQRVLDLMSKRRTHLRYTFETLGADSEAPDVTLLEPERRELGRHLLAFVSRRAKAGSDNRARECDNGEYEELQHQCRIGLTTLRKHYVGEVQHHPEARHEGNAGSRQEQRAHRDYEDVKRRQLRMPR